MSFTHMETFNFRVQRMLSFQTGEYDEYSYAPKWPSPFPSCTLEGTSQNTKMSLRWESAEPQIYVAEGNMKVVTSDSATVFNLDFAFGAFPPFPSGSVPYVHSAAQYWNRACTMTMSLVLLDYPFKTNHEDYAESFAASMISRVPNDVCIHFPRTGQSLWSNETILKKASPYLSSLLSSGFSEGEPISKDDGTSADKAMIDPFEFEDSDEESDQMPLSESTSQASDFGIAKFKRIDVTQATYTTYANVLCWIGSGYISFAPLKSTKRFPSTPASPEPPQSPSSLPTPASPKSVYRLAHLLEVPDLIDLALGNFKKQLTTQNVAYELYTDVASTYPQIRDLAIKIIVANWEEVVKSEAYKEVKKRAETEGIDSFTATLLAEKLADEMRPPWE